MLLLPIPTIELVKAECAAFDDENQLAEHALDQLRTHFPLNTDKSHVLLKVLTLNKLYSTRINDKDIEATARHIAALGVDSLLDQGSHSAVDLIANIPNLRRCYSFATKFCSWHNPAAFPLYDGYVDLCLWSYRKQGDQEVRPPFAHFHRQDFWNYSRLVEMERPIRQRERTFKECADLALTYSSVHKSNVSDDSQKIAILIEKFGARIASTIKQQEITSFLESRNRSNATFNRYRATISMIYREAIREGWLDTNPARLVKAKKETNGRVRYLSDGEEARLRCVIANEYANFLIEFELALHTGMRLSEQFALLWDEVDLKEKRIDLTKTKNGTGRSIPLNSVASAALEDQTKITGHSRNVFLNASKQAFRKSPIRRWFEEATAKAKVNDFTWHCLRHTYASRLVMAGVDLRTVQELMGHKTIQMTVRYSHLSKPHLFEAIERLVPKTGAREAPGKSSRATGTRTGTGAKTRNQA